MPSKASDVAFLSMVKGRKVPEQDKSDGTRLVTRDGTSIPSFEDFSPVNCFYNFILNLKRNPRIGVSTRTAPGRTGAHQMVQCGARCSNFKNSVPGAVLGAEEFKTWFSVRRMVLSK